MKTTKTRQRLLVSCIITAILAVVIILSVVLISRSRCHGLIGNWRSNDPEYEGDFIYHFADDGNGSYDTPYGTYTFTFTDNSGSFTALYTGDTITSTYPYSIEDDILTITDSFGNPVTYVCE